MAVSNRVFLRSPLPLIVNVYLEVLRECLQKQAFYYNLFLHKHDEAEVGKTFFKNM